ncbi:MULTISPECIES: ribonuclease E [unclassified Marinobacter]|uniref:ribonuclease E n=1 Tax=unclassified Marinobacter TaxID=83889 RepID=UPI00200EF8F8|nr:MULTISPECIES: ribonuclease E [unclassified Marinobacter]UQG54395.1 ribonuclease E [Marinobacter sp. M4C]UQG63202.1 ribonuclease E [Marinobacter sp. M2C]UQG67480.1 ribonuclease E [Marinobacter sp. M1C]
MKRMLINATHPEELRVALVDGQRLFDLDIESSSREQKKANIYKGKITRVEPSLEAAFVDFGADRHGFLPLKEISKEYFKKSPGQIEGKVNIKDVIAEGQEVIVQVDKEERGNKGAALTTYISLAGRYLVLMPNNARAGGISRRIEGEERAQLKEAMNQVQVPKSMGIIVRTAGIGRNSEELQWDLDYLVQFWEAITQAAGERKAPFLIHQESNVIIRAVRDYLRQDIGEVLIDAAAVHEDVLNFVRAVMPTFENKIKLYSDEIPLFSRYQIEGQIETAFQREVKLPSGGSIVIDPTEALVSIDINSSRATKGHDIEETALQTNLEAAEEIGRQLRLRDMGGLIVIDFIDMTPARNQREVENKMREALEIDRARVQVGKISRFGLLEMSRQRLRPSLGETRSEVCPRCEGQGTIRGIESLALSIMRLIYEESSKDKTGEVRAVVPVSVATFLLNEKRKQLATIEANQEVSIVIVPVPQMETPHFEIIRMRDDEAGSEHVASHQVAHEYIEREEEVADVTVQEKPVREQAAVKSVRPASPAPAATPAAAPAKVAAEQARDEGMFSRLGRKVARFFNGEEESQSVADSSRNAKPASSEDRSRQRPTSNRNDRQDRRKTRVARDDQQDSRSNGERSSSSSSSSSNRNDDNRSRSNRGRARNEGRSEEKTNAGSQNSNAQNSSAQSSNSQSSSAQSNNVQNGNAQSSGNDTRRDGRRDNQNRSRSNRDSNRDTSRDGNKPNAEQADQKPAIEQKSAELRSSSPSPSYNDQNDAQSPAVAGKAGGDEKRRSKPRRSRGRDGSPAEKPVSNPAERKAARSEIHQQDTQPETRDAEERAKAKAKAAEKPADAQVQPAATAKPAKQAAPQVAQNPADASPETTNEQPVAAKAVEKAPEPEVSKPAAPASEAPVETAPESATVSAAKTAPSRIDAYNGGTRKAANKVENTEAPEIDRPDTDSAPVEAVEAEAPKAETHTAEATPTDAEDESADRPTKPIRKRTPARKAKASKTETGSEQEPQPANTGASDDNAAEADVAVEQPAAQVADAASETPAAPVAPGRAYNDPREVRKRQRAADAAQNGGSE